MQAQLLAGQARLLRAMSEVSGLEPSNLARLARLAPSTVNRALVNGAAATVLSTVSIAALARVVEGRLAEMAVLGGDPAPRRMRWEAALRAWNGLVFLEGGLSGVEVVGHVQAGEWQEAVEWPLAERYKVQAPIPAQAVAKAFALEIRGRAMDREYPEGSIAICVRYSDLGREPQARENVLCHLRREDGRVEATIKKLEIDAEGHRWLTPQSTDPRLQQPIALDESDGIAPAILALVIASFRPEPVAI
jgi:SOS-response transcriptional repressor LexA